MPVSRESNVKIAQRPLTNTAMTSKARDSRSSETTVMITSTVARQMLSRSSTALLNNVLLSIASQKETAMYLLAKAQSHSLMISMISQTSNASLPLTVKPSMKYMRMLTRTLRNTRP